MLEGCNMLASSVSIVIGRVWSEIEVIECGRSWTLEEMLGLVLPYDGYSLMWCSIVVILSKADIT